MIIKIKRMCLGFGLIVYLLIILVYTQKENLKKDHTKLLNVIWGWGGMRLK